MKYHLAPSILPVDLDEIGVAVQGLLHAGVRWIQVDVMDGHFVPNFTYGPPAVKAVSKHIPKKLNDEVVVDAHLMIENPELWVADYIKAGANLVTVHTEATRHLHGVIQMIKKSGARAGAAVNPATPVSMLYDVLGDLDLALVMSVNPGFGGQAFIPGVLEKIRTLRAKIDTLGLKTDLQVDGGVKLDNVAETVRAGANCFVSGSGVFGDESAKKGNFGPVVKAFMDAIEEAAAG